MIRKGEQRFHFELIGVQAVMGDLIKDISQIAQTVDKVIFAASSGGKAVAKVYRDGAKRSIDYARWAIKKFVMLSSMGADKPQEPLDLKDYLQAKHDADV